MDRQRKRKSNGKLDQIPTAVLIQFFFFILFCLLLFCKFLKKTDRHADRRQNKDHTEFLRQRTFKSCIRIPVKNIHHIEQHAKIWSKSSLAHHFQRHNHCQIYKICLHYAKDPQQDIRFDPKHHMQIINHDVKSIRVHTCNPDVVPIQLIDPVVVYRDITGFITVSFDHIRPIDIRNCRNRGPHHSKLQQHIQPLLSFSTEKPPVNGPSQLHKRSFLSTFSTQQTLYILQNPLDHTWNLTSSFPDPHQKKRPHGACRQCHTIADMKKLQQIYQIDDIKISRKKISGQLFRSRKTAEQLPEYQPWEEQSYNAICRDNFQKL